MLQDKTEEIPVMEAAKAFDEYIGSFEKALEIVNGIYWNLSIQQKDYKWLLWGGDQLICTFESEVELRTFIFGMALAIGVLPPNIITAIRKLGE